MTEYVALILEKDGKFLAERRKRSKPIHPGDVVFPAGKIEQDETKEEAIIREMKEELGIDIINPQIVYESDPDSIECDVGQKIYFFKIDGYSGNIENNEAEELIWIEDPGDLTYNLSRMALDSYLKQKFK